GGFHTRGPTLGWGVLSGGRRLAARARSGAGEGDLVRPHGRCGRDEAVHRGQDKIAGHRAFSLHDLLSWGRADFVRAMRCRGGDAASGSTAPLLLDTVPRRGVPGSSPTPG